MIPTVRCRHVSSGGILAYRIRYANTFCSRFKGLLGETGWQETDGLLLVPCNSIHTLGMIFPIAGVFLSADDIILRLIPEMPPWHLGAIVWPARKVLELPIRLPAFAALQVGDRLVFETHDEESSACKNSN